MALIQTVPPEKAEGIVKEGYEMYLKRIGVIPKPMEMISASPKLFEILLSRTRYLSTHPRLSFSLLAHIRYLVAHHLGYRYCMELNRRLLEKQGLESADIRKMESDPSRSLLEENENAMLAFVLKAVKIPESITTEDTVKLRNLGWEDGDMVDALAQGVSMIDHAIMMKAFNMEEG